MSTHKYAQGCLHHARRRGQRPAPPTLSLPERAWHQFRVGPGFERSSPTVCEVDPSMACSPSSIAESANCETPNSAVQSYVSPTGTQLLGFVNDGATESVLSEYNRICSGQPRPEAEVKPPGGGGVRNYAVTQCDYGRPRISYLRPRCGFRHPTRTTFCISQRPSFAESSSVNV